MLTILSFCEFISLPDEVIASRVSLKDELQLLAGEVERAVAMLQDKRMLQVWILPPGNATAEDWLVAADQLIEWGDPLGDAIVAGVEAWRKLYMRKIVATS